MAVRVIVTGGRAYQYRNRVFATLDRIHAKYPDLLIIHGDYPGGADEYAREWCESRGVAQEPHPAQWSQHKGGSAGPIRNSEMVNAGAAGVVAFSGGNGTRDCVSKARKAGIPVMQVD